MLNIMTRRYLKVATFLSLLFLLVGCQATKQAQVPAVGSQDNVQKDVAEQLRRELHAQQQRVEELEQQLERQKQLTGNLQLKLLSRHAEIDKLVLTNERLVRDFARNISKARSRGDKTETIRLIAEVDTLLISFAEDTLSGSQQTSLLRAKKYLRESKEELEKDNLELASYLANQALSLTQDMQLKARNPEARGDAVDIDFLVPLPMTLLDRSNVRSGPSIKDKVLFVLMKGARVAATGYRGQWVKVEIPGRGEGWVYYSLLKGI